MLSQAPQLPFPHRTNLPHLTMGNRNRLWSRLIDPSPAHRGGTQLQPAHVVNDQMETRMMPTQDCAMKGIVIGTDRSSENNGTGQGRKEGLLDGKKGSQIEILELDSKNLLTSHIFTLPKVTVKIYDDEVSSTINITYLPSASSRECRRTGFYKPSVL